MVVTDSEIISPGDVVESPLQSAQQANKNNNNNNYNPFSSLGRQSSIYSLTLDEFQHTLCESGKNFGSMNMDEFLASIWTAEENATTNNQDTNNSNSNNGINNNSAANQALSTHASGERSIISEQPSLPRQGSLSLPAPLCRKTVDEVWSEIHRSRQQQGNGHSHGSDGDGDCGGGNSTNGQNSDSAPRQRTFGEMTLEDFLIKAGVVREQCASLPQAPPPQQQQQYGLYQGNSSTNPSVGTGFVSRSILGVIAGNGSGAGGGVGYQTIPPGPAPPPPVYGGRVGNGGGGYKRGQGMGVVNPVSSDGMVAGVDNAVSQFGMEMGGLRGRKRIIDGPVERVVERRQRRMIKNRESAARSRARKQAYTVELEAELNQLKEENKQLKHALAELEWKRKQQYLEESRMKSSQTKAQKAKEKLRVMRRNLSCHL